MATLVIRGLGLLLVSGRFCAYRTAEGLPARIFRRPALIGALNALERERLWK